MGEHSVHTYPGNYNEGPIRHKSILAYLCTGYSRSDAYSMYLGHVCAEYRWRIAREVQIALRLSLLISRVTLYLSNTGRKFLSRFRISRRCRDRGTSFRHLGSGINIVIVSLTARNAMYNTTGRPLTVSADIIPLVQ